MDNAKMVIQHVLNELEQMNISELHTTLENALALINGLSPWDAEKALKVLFGGDPDGA